LKHKLKVVEIRKDKPIDIPEDAIPLKLERILELNGLVNPFPSSDSHGVLPATRIAR